MSEALPGCLVRRLIVEQQRGNHAGIQPAAVSTSTSQKCPAAPVNHRKRRKDDTDNRATTVPLRSSPYLIASYVAILIQS